MTYTVSITSQGQISIPAKIRKKLGFFKNKKALVTVEEGKMVIKPVKDFLEIGGTLKTNKKPLSNKQLDEFVGEYFAREHKK